MACAFDIRTARILISIRPNFAQAILRGQKLFELRRTIPQFRPGDLALVYASSPIQKVVGHFTVERILSGTPKEVWDNIGQEIAGIPKHGFFAYLAGSSQCAAIQINNPRSFDRPLPLPFRAPQSYLFLRPENSSHQKLLDAVCQ
ncbi:MAG: hypothetical protein V1754_01430 [Pseudomonadota bacterium]